MILGNAQLGWCTAALCFILPGHKASSASKCRNIINDGSGASVPSFVIQSKRWESAQDSPRKQGRKKLYGWYVGSLPQFQLWNGKQSSSALQPRTSLQRCTGRSALVLSSFRDPDVDNRAAPFLNPCHALNISSWKRESANDDRLVSDTPKAERGIGVGIDLGTTNSAVAILRRYVSSDDNKETIVAPIILPIDDDGQDDNALTTASTTMRRTVPSVVCFPDPKVVLVGRIAVKKEHLYPSSTYRNVKRIIGTGGQIALENAPLVPNFALHSESVSSLNTKPSNSLENLNSSETVAFTGVKQKIGGIEKYKKTKKQGYSNKRGKLTSHESPASSISLSKQLKDALETPALLSVQFAN